jgi:hypothetical protein
LRSFLPNLRTWYLHHLPAKALVNLSPQDAEVADAIVTRRWMTGGCDHHQSKGVMTMTMILHEAGVADQYSVELQTEMVFKFCKR